MFTPRYLYTFLAVLIGLGLTPLLPVNFKTRPTAVKSELPTFVGNWFGEFQEVSQRELDILAKDTKFSRRIYTNLDSKYAITVSVVISGQDLNNSIHRPERCLPAQGWTVNFSNKGEIPIAGLSTSPLPLTCLQNYRITEIPPQPGNKALKEGGTHRVFNRNDYFFVGADTITRSHYVRTFQDMWDRVVLGQNQQWAYVTFAVNYSEQIIPKAGISPEERAKMEKQIDADREAADKALREFMAEILPELLPKWRQSVAVAN